MIKVVKGQVALYFSFLYISYIEHGLATSLNKYLTELMQKTYT